MSRTKDAGVIHAFDPAFWSVAIILGAVILYLACLGLTVIRTR